MKIWDTLPNSGEQNEEEISAEEWYSSADNEVGPLYEASYNGVYENLWDTAEMLDLGRSMMGWVIIRDYESRAIVAKFKDGELVWGDRVIKAATALHR